MSTKHIVTVIDAIIKEHKKNVEKNNAISAVYEAKKLLLFIEQLELIKILVVGEAEWTVKRLQDAIRDSNSIDYRAGLEYSIRILHGDEC
jgi:hypothetical protein